MALLKACFPPKILFFNVVAPFLVTRANRQTRPGFVFFAAALACGACRWWWCTLSWKRGPKVAPNLLKSMPVGPLVCRSFLEGVPVHHFSPLGYRKSGLELFWGAFQLKKAIFGDPKKTQFRPEIFLENFVLATRANSQTRPGFVFFWLFCLWRFFEKNVKIAGPFFAAKNCVQNIAVFFSGYKTVYKTLKNLPFEVDWAFLTSTWPVFSLFGGSKMAENPVVGSLFGGWPFWRPSFPQKMFF